MLHSMIYFKSKTKNCESCLLRDNILGIPFAAHFLFIICGFTRHIWETTFAHIPPLLHHQEWSSCLVCHHPVLWALRVCCSKEQIQFKNLSPTIRWKLWSMTRVLKWKEEILDFIVSSLICPMAYARNIGNINSCFPKEIPSTKCFDSSLT